MQKYTIMKYNFLKLIPILIILLTTRSIALGQVSSSDSITISRDQQRACIIWFKEGIVKDSIINTKDVIIDTQRSFIAYTDTVIATFDLKLNKSLQDLEEMKQKRKNAFIIGAVGTVGGIILGFFIKP